MTTSLEREKQRIASTSVVAAVFLMTLKLIVGLATNSLGLLSEAAHSGLDFLAAVMTYVAVRIADRPPDAEHHYGHGKFENISAFIETLLLVLTCAWIIYEALDRFFSHTHHVEVSIWSFLVMATSIIVDVTRSRALYRVAKKANSQALEADALHFSSDVWSSLTVIVGLLFVSFGFPEFDAFAAITVALLVLFVSYRLGQRTIDALMDRVPAGKLQTIEQTIRSVEGVEDVRSVRIRTSGARLFIDTVVGIRRTLPFQHAHAIMDTIERSIHAIEPFADVIVHAEPYTRDDETLIDKIRMIVLDHHFTTPHNLEVHLSNGKYHIDFDVEYIAGCSFEDAHKVASALEQRIKREIPSIEKVTIHLEESEIAEHSLVNVTDEQAPLARRIRDLVMKENAILSCENVTLLQEGNGFHLSLDCALSKTRTLEEVHTIVSGIERTLYDNFPLLRRITIHAEPT